MSWRKQYPDLVREIDAIKVDLSVLREQVARLKAQQMPARRGRPKKEPIALDTAQQIE
jgi:hypothetical protein